MNVPKSLYPKGYLDALAQESTPLEVIPISEEDNRYGPIEILQNELEEVNNRKILNALNHKNKNIIISVRCETKDLDVKVPNSKWKGWKPAKEVFEKNIIKDFC